MTGLCAHCGKPFSKVSPKAIYCGRGCNSNARYARMFTAGKQSLPDISPAEIDRRFHAARAAQRRQKWSAA